ncbi:MAG: M14 family zinc carboxypeptidase [Polyangiaceae bacterium]
MNIERILASLSSLTRGRRGARPALRAVPATLAVGLCACLGVTSCTTDSTHEPESAGEDVTAPEPVEPGAAPQTDIPRKLLLVHVYYETEENLERFSEELDLQEHADRKAGYVDALVEPEVYRSLLAEGFRVDVDEEQTALINQMPYMSISGYSCYRTVEETASSMASLESTYPDLISITDIGDSYEKVTPGGAAGYDLQVMVVTNEAIPGPKPRFFLMGAIHAREYATAELAMRFAEGLVTDYGTDPDATWLLDNFELHVLPQSNPDGRKIAEQSYSQRKNRRPGGNCSNPPTSSSQLGVDLNRNSSFKWGGAGTSSSKCNLTYKGASAASEPETQSIQTYVGSIFDDQRGPLDTDAAPSDTNGLLISLHAYGELVLFPWGWSASAAPNLAQLQTLGRKFGYLNGHDVCQPPTCLYAASGTTDDWSYGTLGIASYTFEMGTSFFQSCSSFESSIAPGNLAALRTAFKHARRPYETPKGPDALNVAVSASPVTAGAVVTLTATADDTRYDSHGWGTEPTQNIAAARYTIGDPSWVSGVTPTAMSASDGTFDATSEGVTASIDTTGWSAGRYLLLVEGQDADGNWGAPTGVFLDVQ